MAAEKLRIKDNFGLYIILTSPVRGYEYCTNVCVEYELPFIQLRMKEHSEYRALRVAEKLRYITENSATRLIINDYPRVARDCAADGVHVGQEDMPFDEVKALVGPEMLVGLSTHNPAQTGEACEKMPDYIGIGPVYATPTKKVPDPALGLDGMKEMLAKATVPAVCIGGISLERLPDVLNAGAKNFCMVRPVCEAANPAGVIKRILDIYRKHGGKK